MISEKFKAVENWISNAAFLALKVIVYGYILLSAGKFFYLKLVS